LNENGFVTEQKLRELEILQPAREGISHAQR
jgi:hypothetical protein